MPEETSSGRSYGQATEQRGQGRDAPLRSRSAAGHDGPARRSANRGLTCRRARLAVAITRTSTERLPFRPTAHFAGGEHAVGSAGFPRKALPPRRGSASASLRRCSVLGAKAPGRRFRVTNKGFELLGGTDLQLTTTMGLERSWRRDRRASVSLPVPASPRIRIGRRFRPLSPRPRGRFGIQFGADHRSS